MVTGKSDLVTIDDVEFLHEREASYMIKNADDEVDFLPKKLVELNDDGSFTMPEWLAMEKGLI